MIEPIQKYGAVSGSVHIGKDWEEDCSLQSWSNLARIPDITSSTIKQRKGKAPKMIELYLFQINMTKKPGWSFHVRPYKVKQFSMGASFCYAFTYYQFHLTWLCFGHPMIPQNVLMNGICFCRETYSVEATPFCDDTWYHKIISIM